MAFVLVQWMKDNRTSVIPSAWVVKPNPLPTTFPVQGVCYWRRKASCWETNILASSGESLQACGFVRLQLNLLAYLIESL